MEENKNDDFNEDNKYKKLEDECDIFLDIPNIPLSKKSFALVFTSLVICLAMSSLDSSIVSTALPTISAQFKSDNQYTWVLTAYFLGDMAFEPMFGKFADIFGRKQVLLFVLTLFIVSSALCGAAQSIEALIVFRGFQGIGGGGFFSMVIVIIADIVPLRKRGVYMGITSAVSTCASVTGPLVGGLLTDYLSWRWAFFINFPLCITAGAIIYFYLDMPSKEITSFKEKIEKIDFLGTFLLVGTIVSILLALSWGGVDYPWSSLEIIMLFVSFIVLFTSFILVEHKIAKHPIIPLQMFKNRNVIVTCIINFFFGMAAMTVTNTLPLLFHDGRGISATLSGLMLAPQSITSSLGNILTGYLIGKFGYIQRYMMAGTLVVMLGNYLLSTINMNTPIPYILFIVVLLGLKLGLNTHSCVLITQQCVRKKYISIGSTVMTFFHLIGGILGISLYGILVASKFRSLYIKNYQDMKDEDFGIKDIGTLPDGRFYYVEAIQFTYRIIPFLASIITFIAILFLKKIPVIGSRIQKKKKVVTDTNYQQNTVVEKSNYVNDNDGGSSITETNENNEKTINIPNEVEKEEPKKEHQVGFSNTVEINNNETKVVEFSENTENPVSENDNRYSKRLSYRYSNRFSRYSNRYSNGFDNRASHRYSRYDNRCSTYNKNRISYIFTQMNAVLMDDEDEEDDNDDDDEVLEEEEGVEVTLF